MKFTGGDALVAMYDYGNPQGLIGNYGLLDLADEPYGEFAEWVSQSNEDVIRSRSMEASVQ